MSKKSVYLELIEIIHCLETGVTNSFLSLTHSPATFASHLVFLLAIFRLCAIYFHSNFHNIG